MSTENSSEDFTEIAPGVFTVGHSIADGRNGIVVGTRTAVAIDVGTYPDEGKATADFIRSKGFAADRVILTHGHSDHVLGGEVFKGGEVFAHILAPVVMTEFLPSWAERREEPLGEVLGRALWPTATFDGEMKIDLGGKTLRLFPTPGHSRDHISVYVEQDRVLFAGDTVVTGIVAAISDGDSRPLETSLRKLIMMDIETLVAGHGPPLHGKEKIRDWLEWTLAYLSRVRAFVHEHADATPDEIAAAADFAEFIGDRLPADKFNMPQRHRNTVLKIVAEERESKP